jgi:hypothetical protein
MQYIIELTSLIHNHFTNTLSRIFVLRNEFYAYLKKIYFFTQLYTILHYDICRAVQQFRRQVAFHVMKY